MSKHPQNLAGMIADARLVYVNPGINEQNFPFARPVAEVAQMRIFTHEDLGAQDPMTTAEIKVAADRQGWRPATLAELLVYAKDAWNGEDPVVALASAWLEPHAPPGYCSAPYLFKSEGRRLGLVCATSNTQQLKPHRFLFVRN